MTLKPCPYRALVWADDELVADTEAAIREERPERPAVLWFPCPDVRTSLLGPGPDPLRGEGPLADHLALDAERFRIELLDESADRQARPTVTRFPDWGDADDLIDMMDLRQEDEGRYRSVARADWRRPVVEASQVLGQTIVAAMRRTGGRRVVSASLIALRAADARLPMTFVLDHLTHGRTFSALSARVEQNDRLIAVVQLLLDTTAPDVIRHALRAPNVPAPFDCPPHDMGVTGRDLRIVDAAYTGDPDAPVGPPELDAWVRFRSVPDDPAIHAGLLAQFTGHLSIGAALRAHAGFGERQAHVTLSTAINAIGISFHADVHADQWMLYHHHSDFAGDGMTHSSCRVHDLEGRLLASFTVEGMVRGFASGATGDYRSSL